MNELREQTEAMGGDHVIVEQAFTTFEPVTIHDREREPGCEGSLLECSTPSSRQVVMPVLHLQGHVYATETP